MGIISYLPVLLPIALNGIYGDRYLLYPFCCGFFIWVSFDFSKYKMDSIHPIHLIFTGLQRVPEWEKRFIYVECRVSHSDSSYSKAKLQYHIIIIYTSEMVLITTKDLLDDDVPYLDIVQFICHLF